MESSTLDRPAIARLLATIAARLRALGGRWQKLDPSIAS
jgi:hypothetical protein